MRRNLAGQAVRFVITGLANTALGLGITSALDLGLRVNPQLANAAGYAAGMVLSYMLNRYFVFRPDIPARASVPKFLAAVVVAFGINQLVLYAAGQMLGHAPAMRLSAQVIAMVSYTLVNFILCRAWVFRSQTVPSDARAPAG